MKLKQISGLHNHARPLKNGSSILIDHLEWMAMKEPINAAKDEAKDAAKDAERQHEVAGDVHEVFEEVVEDEEEDYEGEVGLTDVMDQKAKDPNDERVLKIMRRVREHATAALDDSIHVTIGFFDA